MIIGTTLYYRMRRDGEFVLRDMDSTAPCRVSDDRCATDEVAIWTADSWDGKKTVAAGRRVRETYHSDQEILDAILN